MAEPSVACPQCGVKLRLSPALQGKPAVRCPKCSATVPLARIKPAALKPAAKPAIKAEPPEDVLEEVGPDEDEVEEVEEVLPASPRKRRRPADEEDERPARPVKRRRVEEEDDEEDEEDEDYRPRRRRKRPGGRRAESGEGPWLIALGLVPVLILVGFFCGLLTNGTHGLPESKEGGPAAKIGGLLFMEAVCCLLMFFGVRAVKNRRAWLRFSSIEGTPGVIVGFLQAGFGSWMFGLGVYGLIFGVIIFTGPR